MISKPKSKISFGDLKKIVETKNPEKISEKPKNPEKILEPKIIEI